MKLKIIIHEAEEGGYWAEVPAIEGCATQGETFEELLENIYEAVERIRRLKRRSPISMTPAAPLLTLNSRKMPSKRCSSSTSSLNGFSARFSSGQISRVEISSHAKLRTLATHSCDTP